jgi:2,5-diketo-D-gluconate reductase A
MTAAMQPRLPLRDGSSIPQLGLGVYRVEPAATADVVGAALSCGYRLIDTAQGYGNEAGVGEAIAASGLPRSQLFTTTKLTSRAHGRDNALRAFDGSMQRLGVDYVDLFLIHWPLPDLDLYVETWRAFVELQQDGRVRSIGVSNFTEGFLQRLIDETGVVPVLNQIELHPWFPQRQLREFHDAQGIVTEAWGPLGQGSDLLQDPRLVDVAQRVGCTPAQVVLRWHLDQGNVVIPKSVRPDRMRENLAALDVQLDDADRAAVSALDRGVRLGPDPEHFAVT